MWRYKPTKISLLFLLSLCIFCNFSNGLCVITCLYVHAHGKCACNTYYWHWHVLLLCVTSSSFDFTTYYYSPICYYHLTLNDKITVCTFFVIIDQSYRSNISPLYNMNCTVSFTKPKCEKKSALYKKGLKKRSLNEKVKHYLWRRSICYFSFSSFTTIYHVYILTLCPQHILEHICGNKIQFF